METTVNQILRLQPEFRVNLRFTFNIEYNERCSQVPQNPTGCTQLCIFQKNGITLGALFMK